MSFITLQRRSRQHERAEQTSEEESLLLGTGRHRALDADIHFLHFFYGGIVQEGHRVQHALTVKVELLSNVKGRVRRGHKRQRVTCFAIGIP
jgi:hypothetical protein